LEDLIEAVKIFSLHSKWEQMNNYIGATDGKEKNQIIKHYVGGKPCERGSSVHVMTQLSHNSPSY